VNRRRIAKPEYDRRVLPWRSLRRSARRGIGEFSRFFTVALLAAVVVSVALLVAATSPPAPAHEPSVSTAAGHLEEDAVAPLDHATAQRFERRTLAATPDRFTAAAAGPPQDPGQLGSWGPVVDWPVVGIHVALLETGKVLAYDSVGDLPTESYDVHDHTRATVWDPATGSQTPRARWAPRASRRSMPTT